MCVEKERINMIVDTLNAAGYYFNVHPGMEAGFAFIQDAINGPIEDGEYEIDGRKVYAIVSTSKSKGIGEARLEIHKKYIDMQVCINGIDKIGWKPIGECVKLGEEYDADKDIGFFDDIPMDYITLKDDIFSVFFPHDAHAPLGGEGKVRKIVIKIEV